MSGPPPTVQEVWVEHPQGRLYTRSWTPAGATLGTPAPILLVHDSLGSVELWRDFPEALCAATGRRVIAYDRLGFGRSSPRQGPLPPDFIADEARTTVPLLRAQLGLETLIALGHSVGGGMAVHCAAQWPQACVGLVTESAQVVAEEQTLDGIRHAQQQFRQAGQRERLARYHGDRADWVLDAWIRTWLDPAFASWSLASVLPQVGCPVLAIHGSDDEFGSRRHPELIAALCRGPVQVEIIEGAHHVPHREDPERIVALIAGFVAALP